MLPHSIFAFNIVLAMTPLKNAGRYLVACLFLGGLTLTSYAQARYVVPAKTPADNYFLTEKIRQDVLTLQSLHTKAGESIELPALSPKQPRHVYQKALEVLAKVNRFRLIKGMGAIVIPHYPARLITPDEVYSLINHLQGEIQLLLPESKRYKQNSFAGENITPTDVYRSLWLSSLALDPLLGIRGFTPNEVYQQAEYIVQLIDFLRLSQNKILNVSKPQKTSNRHSNHVLKAAYELQGKIYRVQKNLWMTVTDTQPEVPRRVIRPTEVYDALQVVIAELQRIKYRLGIDRELPLPALRKNKTPDDVIQLLAYAQDLMPRFDFGNKLFQYDQKELSKTPDDTFLVAWRINQALSALNRARGIRIKSPVEPLQQDITPRHVLQISLQNLRKMNLLREHLTLLPSYIPHPPLRLVTPTEVYEVISRLEKEIQLYFQAIDFRYKEKTHQDFVDKQPGDVFQQMWLIKKQLDILTGPDLLQPRDVWLEGQEIAQTLDNIYRHIGLSISDAEKNSETDNKLVSHRSPELVSEASLLSQSQRLLTLVGKIQQRAGVHTSMAPSYYKVKNISLNDLYANLHLVHDELIALKPYLGIFQSNSGPVKLDIRMLDALLDDGLSEQVTISGLASMALLLDRIEGRLQYLLIPEHQEPMPEDQ